MRHLWAKSISYTADVHESTISLSGVSMGSRTKKLDSLSNFVILMTVINLQLVFD